jgi:Tol biopolymer transport system component
MKPSILLLLLAGIAAGCGDKDEVQCALDTDCGLDCVNGRCEEYAPTGRKWCQCEVDTSTCPGGRQWSSYEVGDGLAGTCVAQEADGGPDAGGDAGGADAPDAAPPAKACIVFESMRDGNREIYRMNSDGLEKVNLSETEGNQDAPVVSAAGDFVAYSSLQDGDFDIVIVPASGGAKRNLSDGELDNNTNELLPSWSPDGLTVAFSSDRADAGNPTGDIEIYTIGASGGEVRQLTNNTATDGDARWSPDGTKIVFQSNRDGNQEIYVMDADGQNQRRLTSRPETDSNPRWSPDGRQIVFVGATGGGGSNSEIFVVGVNGNDPEPTNISNSPGTDNGPEWAPIGNLIAFNSDRSGNQDVWVMGPTGGSPTNISAHPSADNEPIWSPDGAFIAFQTNRDGNSEVYRVAVTGGAQINLSNSEQQDLTGQWFVCP